MRIGPWGGRQSIVEYRPSAGLTQEREGGEEAARQPLFSQLSSRSKSEGKGANLEVAVRLGPRWQPIRATSYFSAAYEGQGEAEMAINFISRKC